jgi:SAM-dependent methyltransferase
MADETDAMTVASGRERTRRRLLGRMPKGGKAAEIGVWEGGFSSAILELAAPAELHLIDPWLYQPEFAETGFGRSKNKDRMDEMYQRVVAKFAGDTRVKVHRAKSKDALESFPDGYFDWVYVDGNHYEPFVNEDLELSRRKVRPGGIIAGDDYNWKSEIGAPVRKAVGALMDRLGSGAALNVMRNQYFITLPE